MNEEEAIKTIEELKNYISLEMIDINKPKELTDLFAKSMVAFQVMKNAYNKEKEKNKKLSWKYENAKDMYIIKDNLLNENYISKDKIKIILNQGKTTINFNQEKIKKISEEIGYLVGSEGTVEQAELFEIILKDYSTRIEVIESLQKLLEE